MTELHTLILQIVNATVQGKKVVVKRRGNKVFLAQAPIIDKNRMPTPNQEEHQHRFGAAVSFASTAMANPEMEKLYRSRATKKRSKFNCAVRDYMCAPVVKSIDISGYNGEAGSIIRIRAKDDFRVKEVKISIYNVADDLVVEGNALMDPVDRSRWNYSFGKEYKVGKGFRIMAVARDIPDNEGKMEITL